jgi:hypothetical protein
MAKKAQDDAARFLDTAQWNNAYTQLIEEVIGTARDQALSAIGAGPRAPIMV